MKVALPRPLTFNNTQHRAATIQRIRIGATRDGKITAIGHENWSGDLPGGRTEAGVRPTRLLYAGANRMTATRLAVLDLPEAGAMRAPGEAPGLMALEIAMDEIAEKLGLDPVELRILNDTQVDPADEPVIETGKGFAHSLAIVSPAGVNMVSEEIQDDVRADTSSPTGKDVITTGPDGVCASTRIAPDTQVIDVGKGMKHGPGFHVVAIAPGPDGVIQSACHPHDHWIDRLQVTRVRRHRDERVATRARGSGACVILHVAHPSQVDAKTLGQYRIFELRKDLRVRLLEDMREHIQPAAMCHADDGVARSRLG